MPIRNAQANWSGDLKRGSGSMRTGSGQFQASFSHSSRFEHGPGTNPEEMIAAAHAGCFSMALSAALSKAGFEPERINTAARAHLDQSNGGFAITRIELRTDAKVHGIDKEKFQEIAEQAKNNCPVSKALAGSVQIDMQAELL